MPIVSIAQRTLMCEYERDELFTSFPLSIHILFYNGSLHLKFSPLTCLYPRILPVCTIYSAYIDLYCSLMLNLTLPLHAHSLFCSLCNIWSPHSFPPEAAILTSTPLHITELLLSLLPMKPMFLLLEPLLHLFFMKLLLLLKESLLHVVPLLFS